MRKRRPGAFFYILSAVYTGLIILFGFQTYFLVDWLFPTDQMIYKVLTVCSFDVMSLLWAASDMFYRFASEGARGIGRWGWGVSFVHSLIASILYMILQGYFRFNTAPSVTFIDIGYAITIFSLVVNILLLTFWIYNEWIARNPHNDEYMPGHDSTVMSGPTRVKLSQQDYNDARQLLQLPPHVRQQVIEDLKQQSGQLRVVNKDE